MSYLKKIHDEAMQDIKLHQLSLFDPQIEGIEVDIKKFFESIYRGNHQVVKLIKGKPTKFINFVHLIKFKSLKDAEEEVVVKFVCDSLKKLLENSPYYEYFTINQLNSPKHRTKEHLSSLNCFVLDFDLQKDGTDRRYTADELAYIIFNEINIYPHFVWETKTEGNYQACFIINQTSGLMKYVMLFESIAKRLSIVLGSDFAATVANKLFRIPKKSIKQYADTEEIYDMDDFKFVFENEFINQRLEQFENEFKENKVINFTEKQLINSAAIQALINCELEDMRNHACFTLALFFYSIGRDKEEVLQFFLNEWYPKANRGFGKRFLKSEIRSCVKSAFSGRYAGASREWIESLSGHPFNYSVYRSTYISQGKYMKKSEIRSKIINWIRENPNTIISQKTLAEILKIGLRSIERNLKEMEQEGVLEMMIEYQGKKRLGTRFELKIEGFTLEKSNRFNFDKLNELDEIMINDELIANA